MSPELYTALLNHNAMAHYGAPNDYVFASSSGRPLNPDQLRETLQKVLKGMDIKLRLREDGLHLLTHTSGSRQTNSIKGYVGMAGTQFRESNAGRLYSFNARRSEGDG